MTNSKNSIITFLVGLSLLFFWYHEIILNINTCLFLPSGDGLKNYYTTLYQVLYGDSFWHFKGMNYPHGENIVFTDAQPVLVSILQSIITLFPALKNYLLGFINSFMLLSIPLAAVFIQRIFSHYKVNVFFAIIMSVCIAFFSPQVMRFTGHYGLSYVFIIPLFYWLYLRFNVYPSVIRSVIIGLLLVPIAFIHVYHLVIIVFLFTAIHLSKAFLTKNYKEIFFHWTIQTLIPFCIVYFILKINDPIIDRPTSPYGFLVYKALWEGYLVAVDSPIIHWVDENILPVKHVGFESKVYLGILTVFSSLFFVIRLTINKFKKKSEDIPDEHILYGAVLLAIFSLGIPFIFGLDFLIQYLGPLKQFRAIARFAWPLFFVLNIYCIVIIYNYRKEILSSKLRIGALTLLLLSFFAEVHIRNTHVVNSISNIQSDDTKYKSVVDFVRSHHNNYQAIIPYPFFFIGSEYLGHSSTENVTKATFESSLISGLPIFGNMASRTSFKQTMDYFEYQVNNRALPYISNNNELPYLLLVDKSIDTFKEGERNIIEAADLILETEDFYIKSLKNLDINKTVHKPVINSPVLENACFRHEENVLIPFNPTSKTFTIKFKCEKPRLQKEYAFYYLRVYSKGAKRNIIIGGYDDLTYIDDQYFYYQNDVLLNETSDSLQLMAKFTDVTESIIIKSLSIEND